MRPGGATCWRLVVAVKHDLGVYRGDLARDERANGLLAGSFV